MEIIIKIISAASMAVVVVVVIVISTGCVKVTLLRAASLQADLKQNIDAYQQPVFIHSSFHDQRQLLDRKLAV